MADEVDSYTDMLGIQAIMEATSAEIQQGEETESDVGMVSEPLESQSTAPLNYYWTQLGYSGYSDKVYCRVGLPIHHSATEMTHGHGPTG